MQIFDKRPVPGEGEEEKECSLCFLAFFNVVNMNILLHLKIDFGWKK